MNISQIVIPVRPQPDTILAIYLLQKFGQSKYPGVESARVIINPTPDLANTNGMILLDCGGGTFDHHSKTDSTASFLVAKELGVSGDPALSKLIRYAERDDKFGLGTISKDQIDRTFGLSGIIYSLNRRYPDEPEKVIRHIIPLMDSHYLEEAHRIHELPKIYSDLLRDGFAQELVLDWQGKQLKAVLVESDNIGLPGYLRSLTGGNYDVIVQKRSSGHVNVLTKSRKERIPLERFAALIRGSEYYMEHGTQIPKPFAEICIPARIPEITNWYYDKATNSIQNGGVHTDLTPATKIPWTEFPRMTKMAFEK